MTGPPVMPRRPGYHLRYLGWVALLLLVGCAPTTRLRLLMRVPEPQKAQYHESVIRPFEKKMRCRVQLETYGTVEELVRKLQSETDSLRPDVVEVPCEMTLPLAKSGWVRPLETAAPDRFSRTAQADFFFTELGRVENRQWFWPRHLETPLLMYLKSRTTEASRFWDLREPEIRTSLEKWGVAALRKDYALKPDPANWDQLDLFVASSFWRQQELRGKRKARVSLGRGSPHEASLSLMNRALQAGASSDQLLKLDDASVLAALRWQSAFCRERLLRPGSYRGETFDSLIPALQAGEVYLAELTPREAFLAHGNGTALLPGYLPQPEDMGIAPLPKALWPADENEAGSHEGKRGAATRLWLWGLGRGRGDPQLAAQFIEYLSATSSLVFEASSFGLIPARRDVLAELPLIFGGGWAGDVYRAAAEQMIENGQAIPPHTAAFHEVAQAWYEAGREVCRDDKPDLGGRLGWEATQKSIRQRIAPKLREAMPTSFQEAPVSVSESQFPRP
jgi:hypothetical protein